MLSPAAFSTPWVLGVVFALLLAGLALNAIRKDRREYRRFTRMRSTVQRQKMLRRWLGQSFLVFGGSAAVVLLLSWQFVSPFVADVNMWSWIADARRTFDAGGPFALGLAVGIPLGILALSVVGIVLARRETEVPAIGNIQALLPRNRAELPYGAALSINAGVVEELLFRLALPALIFGFTGNSVVAIVVSLIVFGMLHVYQGVWGVVGSMILGALLMAIYLATGSILLAIVAHALIDLRSLVLIPVVVLRVHTVAPENRLAA
jgi:membrane protease YdiL (CAAX protease family)